MAERHSLPRRPAMLEPQAADAIVGDTDPADASEFAHTSAWALLGVGDEEFDRETVERLRQLVIREGIDVIAHMWSRSPEFTLPGAMWRIFLLSEWLRRDRSVVDQRFAQGRSALATLNNGEGLKNLSVEMVEQRCHALFNGEATDDDLEHICRQAAALMRVLAAGENAQWIEDPTDPLAHPVTTRARALVRTAEELEEAAVQAAAGRLD